MKDPSFQEKKAIVKKCVPNEVKVLGHKEKKQQEIGNEERGLKGQMK
jgi:hypothetical protein